MKNHFDRIVGPDGVWTDDAEVVGENGLTAREDYARRCLNAAANLYGILTVDEFVSLYNGYAKNHEPAVARPMTTDELERLVGRLIEFCNPPDDGDFDSVKHVEGRPECWFDIWEYEESGQRLVVQDQFTAVFPDGTPKTLEEAEDDFRRAVNAQISRTAKSFVKVDLKRLEEDEFLECEEPIYSEETEETKKCQAFLVDEYGLDGDQAGLDLWGIQGEIRCNGSTVTIALEYIRDQCDWEPNDSREFERLVREISPVVSVTRTWAYRGHTAQEMCRLGLIDKESREDIPDVFGLMEDEEDGGFDDDDDGGDGDGDYIRLDDLPKPVYNGPIDFKFVKDAVRREAKMALYDDVRQILDGFARKYLAKEAGPKILADAAVRLGYLERGVPLESLSHDNFLAVIDFVSLYDDADDGPAVLRLAKRKGKMDGYDQLALDYFSKARYTWLAVEAVKAGCGMKCRDLMSGEELFLVDRSSSAGDVKGRTFCLGIVPMEDVYIAPGIGELVYLKDPEAELNKVLSQLGLSTERPVRLSSRDQARFVEATLRHLRTQGSLVR